MSNSTLETIDRMIALCDRFIRQNEEVTAILKAMATEAGAHGRWLEERLKSISLL